MKPTITALVGLALLASSYALPIGNGISGVGLAPPALNGFYNQEVTFGDLPVKYGFGFDKDGTVTLGFRVVSTYKGVDLPLTIAVSGNFKDIRRTFKFEAGARIMDKLSGVVYGDKDGFQWLSNVWLPVFGSGPFNAFGAGLEGKNYRPVAVSGGVGVADKLYQARVTLDKEMRPAGTNVILATRKYGTKRH